MILTLLCIYYILGVVTYLYVLWAANENDIPSGAGVIVLMVCIPFWPAVLAFKIGCQIRHWLDN